MSTKPNFLAHSQQEYLETQFLSIDPNFCLSKSSKAKGEAKNDVQVEITDHLIGGSKSSSEPFFKCSARGSRREKKLRVCTFIGIK